MVLQVAIRAAVAATLALCTAAASPANCAWNAQAAGLSFNLTALSLTADAFSIVDNADLATLYTFGICATVAAPIPACASQGDTAYAWQVHNDGSQETCYRLGAAAAPKSFELLDSLFPDRGVVLGYTGGSSEWCPSQQEREFRLAVACAPVPIAIPSTYAPVDTTDTCTYTLTIPSIAGCPTQCVTDGTICSEHGTCGFDWDAGVAHCFCFDGFSGGMCETPTSLPDMLAALHDAPLADFACAFDFGNASFNLAPLQVASLHVVQDNSNNVNSLDYLYAFNVCDDTGVIPNITACNVTYPGTGGPPMPLTGPAGAFQVATKSMPPVDSCHRLSGDVSTQFGLMSWSVISPWAPAQGVVLRYTAGDLIPSTGRPRGFTLTVMCDANATNVPDRAPIVCDPGRQGICQADVIVRSIYGCPTTCPVVRDASGTASLCAAHGICAVDGSRNASRCFCNDGWTGNDCATPQHG